MDSFVPRHVTLKNIELLGKCRCESCQKEKKRKEDELYKKDLIKDEFMKGESNHTKD